MCKNSLTAKQEKFAQGIAKGMTNTDAYKDSYNTSKMKDKTIWERSSIEASKDKVATRVAELKAKVEEKVIEELVIDKEYLIKRFQEIDKAAYKEGNYNASNNSNTQIGKLLGEYVEKSEIDAKVSGDITVNIVTGGNKNG